ncbi:MAG: ATP/GTP-binding protein [Selenomonas massiliensis]|jgi:hypothetical protein|uniref:AAA family ATPase n=1 Tax=Selenomonas sp. oral taxon 126 TaxID=712528 RepID=UPI000807A16E|nr:AAA family ATPase [Selenomonas sp. oral taxon 126]ANR69908.1 ATPase [Selenomonas sp. oral taxon 126]
MIEQISLKNFGVHSATEWNNLTRINLILGENGTGKTFLLKAIYAAMRTIEQAYRGDSRQDAAEILPEKLRWTFQLERLGELVNKENKEKLFFQMHMDGKTLSYAFGKDTTKQISLSQNGFLESRESNSVFIPAKEVLSLQNVILKSREQDHIFGFDDTYLDLVRALQIPRRQGNNYEGFASNRGMLKSLIDGSVEYDSEGQQWFYKKGNTRYSINATAEGIKKIAVFNQLLANRYVTPESVIFLDEIETSLHPRAVVKFLNIIYDLSKSGIQFFIATHSYFVIKELSLIAKRDSCDMSVLSLNIGEPPRYDNLQNGIPQNSIIEESVRLYEEEIALVMGNDDERD